MILYGAWIISNWRGEKSLFLYKWLCSKSYRVKFENCWWIFLVWGEKKGKMVLRNRETVELYLPLVFFMRMWNIVLCCLDPCQAPSNRLFVYIKLWFYFATDTFWVNILGKILQNIKILLQILKIQYGREDSEDVRFRETCL